MIDSHIHLSYRYYNQTFPYIRMAEEGFEIVYGNRDSLIREMRKIGIECCVEPAIDVDSNQLLLRLCAEYDGFLYPAVGNHPTRCIRSTIKDFRKVRDYAKDERVVAIGETGLDYHYKRKDQHRLKQKIWFLWLIHLADERKLPLILHIRMADEDAIRILRRKKRKLHGGVCHCFNGGLKEAKAYTEELGLCLGIGGSILAKPKYSAPLQEAVAAIPLEYILLETDGPYVKPVKPDAIPRKQWEKARNTSLILPAIAKKVAELKGVSAEEVMRATAENAKRVFGLS